MLVHGEGAGETPQGSCGPQPWVRILSKYTGEALGVCQRLCFTFLKGLFHLCAEMNWRGSRGDGDWDGGRCRE